MRVYRIDRSGFELFEDIIDLHQKYSTDNRKHPNQIDMSQSEYDTLKDFLTSFAGFNEVTTGELTAHNSILGMKINIIR